MTSTVKMTDQERIALQRSVTAAHIQGECDGDYEFVRSTFVQDDRAYFDAAPGGLRLFGTGGVADWYVILSSVLPDLQITVTHEYVGVGCCLREMTASSTHSAEFAGIKPEGRFVTWEAISTR